MNNIKGNKIELVTFKKWGKAGVIGHEVQEINGKSYVTKVWCKICAKHSNAIRECSFFRGSAKASLNAFISGTTAVTKYQVDRHLAGECHKRGIELESHQSVNVSKQCF